MGSTSARLDNTTLRDRTLWYDGSSSFTPEQLLQAIKTQDVRFVTELTPLIDEYNRCVSKEQQLTIKTDCDPIRAEWTIPSKYKNLDVVEYVSKAHYLLYQDIDPAELRTREKRLAHELLLFKRLRLFDVLRAIIWIINTLTVNDVVWGVGRGSSVSSYVLFVIGVHDVDSVTYGLDIDDFLRE
jgi:DNA polymerase III alpha subunit